MQRRTFIVWDLGHIPNKNARGEEPCPGVCVVKSKNRPPSWTVACLTSLHMTTVNLLHSPMSKRVLHGSDSEDQAQTWAWQSHMTLNCALLRMDVAKGPQCTVAPAASVAPHAGRILNQDHLPPNMRWGWYQRVLVSLDMRRTTASTFKSFSKYRQRLRCLTCSKGVWLS